MKDPMFASQMQPRPPHCVVVFRRPSENNAELLSRVLGEKRSKKKTALQGCLMFESSQKEVPQARLYTQLGVAVADLDEAQTAKLREDDSVVLVAENELRSIPPIPDLESGAGSVAVLTPQDSISGRSPMEAYLMGMRDAAGMALERLGQDAATAGPGMQAAKQAGGHTWCLDTIGVTPGYQRATGLGVRVAVLDTGVDLTHPDFAGVFTEGVNAVSFVPHGGVQDGNGHGTHCVGVAGGPRQPVAGPRYGVAPDANLLVGKVLSDGGSGYDDWILDGIQWAVEQGAQVISLSLGSARKPNAPYAALYETVANTLHQGGADVLFVAASGNESNRPWYRRAVGNPAACPSFMAIAAVDQNRRIAPFGCAQLDAIGEVNLSAPGVAVRSAWTGGGYRSIAGTSMATPHVAGVAALYRELNPTLDWRTLWRQMEQNAVKLGDPTDFGQGLVQAP